MTNEVTTERKIFKLSDSFIHQLEKIVQLHLFNAASGKKLPMGASVTDDLRMLKVEEKTDGTSELVLTPEYETWFQGQLEKLNDLKTLLNTPDEQQ